MTRTNALSMNKMNKPQEFFHISTVCSTENRRVTSSFDDVFPQMK